MSIILPWVLKGPSSQWTNKTGTHIPHVLSMRFLSLPSVAEVQRWLYVNNSQSQYMNSAKQVTHSSLAMASEGARPLVLKVCALDPQHWHLLETCKFLGLTLGWSETLRVGPTPVYLNKPSRYFQHQSLGNTPWGSASREAFRLFLDGNIETTIFNWLSLVQTHDTDSACPTKTWFPDVNISGI